MVGERCINNGLRCVDIYICLLQFATASDVLALCNDNVGLCIPSTATQQLRDETLMP